MPSEHPLRRRAASGFTLIEVLVVIAIIGILAGLLIPTIVGARNRGYVTATTATIQTMRTALESYQVRFGDYPPTSLAAMKVRLPNDLNVGIESAVACLSTTKSGGPYLQALPEEQYGNFDKDSLGSNPTSWWFGDTQLREVLDGWGRPLVYFHNRDYARPGPFAKVTTGESVEICAPAKSPQTGAYHNPMSYQIWSFGADGKNQNGEEDDVGGW